MPCADCRTAAWKRPSSTASASSRGLDHFGIDVRGRRVLVVGAGGGGHAVAAAIAQRGPAALAVFNRTRERAASLVQRLQPIAGAAASVAASADPAGFDLVVNCTSQGLKPDDPDALRPAAGGRRRGRGGHHHEQAAHPAAA